MKKIHSLIFICVFIFKTTNAQTTYSSEKDVYNSKKIIFYGFDFTDFQLADAKRIGQDLKKYVFTLTGFLVEHLPEKKLKKWINKDTVTYNLNPTMLVNKKINNDDIATAVKHTISKDSIQSFINKYSISEKEGIGYVIIFECFDNSAKRVSAYSVFFDISTKNILTVDYVSDRDSNSFNRLSDWNAAAFVLVKKLTESYEEKEELNNKPVK